MGQSSAFWSNASNLSTIRGLGVWVASGEMLDETSGCGVKIVSGESFFVQLLVFEAGLLVCVTVSMLTVAGVVLVAPLTMKDNWLLYA